MLSELENHMTHAFKTLEEQFQEQQIASESALQSLQAMYEHTSLENQTLQRHIKALSEQAIALDAQVNRLTQLVETLNTQIQKLSN